MFRRIAIALFAAAALAVVWRAVVQRQARASRVERTGTQLLTFDDRAVSAVTMTVGGVAWRVVRARAGWTIESPIHEVADTAALEGLLVAARTAPVVQTIDPVDDLAGFGLAPPQASIVLEGGGVPAIEVGKTTPTGEGVFLRIEGRPGILVAGLPQAAPFQSVTPEDFRDTSWTGTPQSEIVVVTVARGGASVRVDKRGDGWWITSPRALPAATAQVDRLLGVLSNAKVVAVDDTARVVDPRYGLGDAATRFTLETASDRRDLALGGDAGQGRRFATNRARQTMLLVAGKGLEAIPSDVEALRDRRVTNVNRYSVVRMVYEGGGKRYAASRVDEKLWKTDGGGELAAGDAFAFLVTLLEAETTGWSEGKPSGAPVATLTFRGDDGKDGRLDFFSGNGATWDGLPGVAYRLAGPPPAVPDQK